ncbi:O-antigen ligase family protein [Marinisporobacter balticus]|uniref:O-antigen ligase-like membrane protein n=1 Tax=Marinisporobacter balticus TaxID=2018667 RepID=A0A4R2L805_9FIRM|nr:O-antigen ligase family protein [Marinisporobacter balticus]TCO78818.1 O-antigen ligase-like membrane protein [Marinisporobacter balticus]
MATKVKNKRKFNIETSGKNGFIFGLLCILLFYPPFFRGLFFDQELLPTHIFSFGLGTVWLFTKMKSKGRVIRSIPDILGLAIVGMYFISIFYGVNIRLAIGEFLKYANYYMIYLLVRDYTVDDEKNKKIILNVLLLSGVVVSIIGIGSAIGTFSYNGAFVSGRINSTFQYPNALASYLIALFIVALGLLQNSENIKEKFFYAVLANLFIFTFIPTFSRGMWVLAPVVFMMYFILVPVSKKIQTVIYGLVTIIPAAVFSLLFIKGIGSSNGLMQWGVLLISIIITIGITYLCEKRIEKLDKISYKSVFKVGVIVIVIIGIMGGIALNTTQPLILSNMNSEKDTWKFTSRNISDVLKNKEYRLEVNETIKNPENKTYAGEIDIYSVNNEGKSESLLNENITESKHLVLNFTTTDETEAIRINFINYYINTEVAFDQATLYDAQTEEKIKDIKLKYKYIPESLVARINSFDLSGNSTQARFSFYKDAFKIIKDYPILGAGGGAWATIYFTYQSYMYWSTQAHNYIMQLWIEIGTLGFLIYITFIGTLLFNVYKAIRKSKNVKTKMMQTSICVGWLTLLIHSMMDFDLSLGAMSILLWALLGLTNQMEIKIGKKETNSNSLRYISISICLLLVIGSGFLHLGQQYSKKAIAYAQNNAIQEAIGYFEKATKVDPFTGTYHTDLATVYTIVGKKQNQYSEKAVKEISKAVVLEGYNAKILKKAAQIYMEAGQFDKGLAYTDKAVEVQPMNADNYADQTQAYLAVSKYFIDTDNRDGIDMITDRISNIKHVLNKNSQEVLQPFKYSKDLDYNLQKLDYLLDYKDDKEQLKKLDKIAMYNKFDVDIDQNEIPGGARIWNTKEGNLQVQNQAKYIVLKNTGDGYGLFYIDNLSLQEEKKYKLEIEYSSTLKDEDFDLYVYDLSNDSKVIAKLENVKDSKKFIKAELEITVPKGVVAEKQRIGIVHRGKSNGVIKIESINVIEK